MKATKRKGLRGKAESLGHGACEKSDGDINTKATVTVADSMGTELGISAGVIILGSTGT